MMGIEIIPIIYGLKNSFKLTEVFFSIKIIQICHYLAQKYVYIVSQFILH